MLLERFRGRTNRYTRTHNTPTQQLNNAASLSCLLSLSLTSVFFAQCEEEFILVLQKEFEMIVKKNLYKTISASFNVEKLFF